MTAENNHDQVDDDEIPEALLAIYLDGFVSGAYSAFVNVATPQGAERPDPKHESEARVVAAFMADRLSQDPLAIEELRNEIRERLSGVDSGTKAFSLPIDDEESP